MYLVATSINMLLLTDFVQRIKCLLLDQGRSYGLESGQVKIFVRAKFLGS